MLYTLYEAGYYAAAPLRAAARATRAYWNSPLNPARETPVGRRLFASADLFSNLTRR
jgi:poly(3-hydroxybutyrate) depolymerase